MSSYIENDQPGANGDPAAQPPQTPPENSSTPGADSQPPTQPDPAKANGEGDQSAKPDSKPYTEWNNAEWARHRAEKKIRKEMAAATEQRIQEELAKFDQRAAGKIPEDTNELRSFAQDTNHELMQYKVNDFVSEHPDFAEHKSAIQQAIADERYPGLGVAEVALLVAGQSLLAKGQQQQVLDRNTPAAGTSARGYDASKSGFDPSNMSLKDIESIAQQSKAGKQFS